ncbi:MAG: 50S ribosomal protein L15 [Gammaproteobacteria bacterium RIFOXYA12_FULL_61_12]|nr:MAG: 50S ribosomal protein L15 [Gammaproteobacteria bacterium RIFOXYD12_FULL_61_37]OGT90494.1 MAG: 50S ribosomal protein L15 [Gammaproteobacteria bacterium RIFOXYA12_FULL_61_12]
MRLNALKPAAGSRPEKKRVGRGIGCGLGKTCGRGHKGQTSRAGGFHKVGFEGGQMPLQRRLPKVGFNSRMAKVTAEIRLGELGKVEGGMVDLVSLQKAGVISNAIQRVRVIKSGVIDKPVTLKGVAVTKGAREAIEAAGGKIED